MLAKPERGHERGVREVHTHGESYWTHRAGATVTLFVTDALFERGR